MKNLLSLIGMAREKTEKEIATDATLARSEIKLREGMQLMRLSGKEVRDTVARALVEDLRRNRL